MKRDRIIRLPDLPVGLFPISAIFNVQLLLLRQFFQWNKQFQSVPPVTPCFQFDFQVPHGRHLANGCRCQRWRMRRYKHPCVWSGFGGWTRTYVASHPKHRGVLLAPRSAAYFPSYARPYLLPLLLTPPHFISTLTISFSLFYFIFWSYSLPCRRRHRRRLCRCPPGSPFQPPPPPIRLALRLVLLPACAVYVFCRRISIREFT